MNEGTPSYDPAPRALAAILFTDVAGFSALVGQNEAAALAALARDFKLMTGLVESHGGKIVKNLGDGLLVLFPSAVQATQCALQIQETIAAAPKDDMPKLAHRIGLHLGDVVMVDGDALGDGVNVAARLQTEADPGGICLSQTIFDTVKGRVQINARFVGELDLKNIVESVRAYKVAPGAKGGYTKTPRSRTTWKAPALAASIVVLAGAVVFLGYALLNKPGGTPPERVLVPVQGVTLADYKLLADEAKRANDEIRRLREQAASSKGKDLPNPPETAPISDKSSSQKTAPAKKDKPVDVPVANKVDPPKPPIVRIDADSIKETVGGFMSDEEMKALDETMEFAFSSDKKPGHPAPKVRPQTAERIGRLSLAHTVLRAELAAASSDDPLVVEWPGAGSAKVWQGSDREIVIQQGDKIKKMTWREIDPKAMQAMMKSCLDSPRVELKLPRKEIMEAMKTMQKTSSFRFESRRDKKPQGSSKGP